MVDCSEVYVIMKVIPNNNARSNILECVRNC